MRSLRPSEFFTSSFLRIVALGAGIACSASSASAQQADSSAQASTPATAPARTVTFTLQPSLGVTVESDSRDDDEVFTAQWLAGLQSKYFSEGEPYQLGASVYAKYGQLHSKEFEPKKTQDDLILSVTPSFTVLPGPGIRLFLEVTGETQFAKGTTDSSETNFLDPLFLYQSLFLGKRFSSQSEDGTSQFDLTAGVGYALQQTLANKFVLAQHRNFVVTENSPLSNVQDQVTFEAGYSAIVDMNYQEELASHLTFQTGWKTVALTKEEFTSDIKNARVTSLMLVGFAYRFLSLDYSGHLVYDHNVSLRRELSQSLVFGFKLKL